MNNNTAHEVNKNHDNSDNKEDLTTKQDTSVETVVIEGFKPFGADSPMPTEINEIKRQLGFKR